MLSFNLSKTRLTFYCYYYYFRGVVSVSISLNNFDMKQCRSDEENEETEDGDNKDATTSSKSNRNRDPFYGTDNCDRVSTQVNINSDSLRRNIERLIFCSFLQVYKYRGKRL